MRFFATENADIASSNVNAHTRREHEARYEMALPHAEAKVVLDLGCGYGYGSALIARKAKGVVGVDRNAIAIAGARERYRDLPNVVLVTEDIFDFLGSTQEKFDLVLLFEVIEHVDRQRELLELTWRATARGGRIFLSTPNRLRTPFFRRNPYHLKELSPEESLELVKKWFSVDIYKGQTEGLWGLLPHSLLSVVTSKLGVYRPIVRISNRPARCKTLIVSGIRREEQDTALEHFSIPQRVPNEAIPRSPEAPSVGGWKTSRWFRRLARGVGIAESEGQP